MKKEIIDIEKWERKTPYKNFVKYSDPSFAMTVRMDVTDIVNYSKETGSSFFANYLYAVNTCLNSVPDFRLRIQNGKVVRYDEIKPSFIVLNDKGVIQTASVEPTCDYEKFYRSVMEKIEKVRKGENQAEFNKSGETDMFYYTAVKWVDFSYLKNPYNYPDAESTSIPRISWGKFVKNGDKYEMSMDISCHHALLDGYPMAAAFNKVQEAIGDFKKYIKG